jgi:hypothetical protein
MAVAAVKLLVACRARLAAGCWDFLQDSGGFVLKTSLVRLELSVGCCCWCVRHSGGQCPAEFVSLLCVYVRALLCVGQTSLALLDRLHCIGEAGWPTLPVEFVWCLLFRCVTCLFTKYRVYV